MFTVSYVSICSLWFVADEFWLGLQKIYSIAQHGEYILHIELEDWKEEKRFIEYTFTLGGPATDYTLHLAPLSGDLPDAMSNHTGMKFSTKDRDNDKHDESNCARNYTGIKLKCDKRVWL